MYPTHTLSFYLTAQVHMQGSRRDVRYSNALEYNKMPGIGKRPSMTYANQFVPPPRRACVEKDVSVSDIVFDPGMRATEPLVDNSEQLTTTQYQEYMY